MLQLVSYGGCSSSVDTRVPHSMRAQGLSLLLVKAKPGAGSFISTGSNSKCLFGIELNSNARDTDIVDPTYL